MAGTIGQSVHGGRLRYRRTYCDRLGCVRRAGDLPRGWTGPGSVQVHLGHDPGSVAEGVPAAHRGGASRRRVKRASAFSTALGAAALGAAALCIGGAWLVADRAAAASAVADSTHAIDAYGQIEDPALQARYERIIQQLRCLVCQNESIADSNVELASDLRRQVREMLVAGKSDDAIFTFMTDRYGEFVRFNPPLEPRTLLIWGAPFIML